MYVVHSHTHVHVYKELRGGHWLSHNPTGQSDRLKPHSSTHKDEGGRGVKD